MGRRNPRNATLVSYFRTVRASSAAMSICNRCPSNPRRVSRSRPAFPALLNCEVASLRIATNGFHQSLTLEAKCPMWLLHPFSFVR